MLPPTAEISSSVQIFFGFFFSLAWSFPALGSFGAAVPTAAGGGCGAAGAGGWDCGVGLGEPESEPDWEDCAGQFRVAKEARTLARMSERRTKPPGRFSLEEADTRSIPAEESRIGGRRTRFAQVGKSKFLSNGDECLLGRADVAVVCIERALVNGKTREEFAAVEIILRKTGEPKPGGDLITLLHEMTAFVNFAKKQADGDIFGDFAFDAREF